MISSSVVVANKKFSEQENDSPVDANSLPAGKQAELAPEERKRGRRMMGVLMGTLSKFKSEEVDKSEANLKRILLEQRLAQKLQEAKGSLVQPLPTGTDTEVQSRRVFFPPSESDFLASVQHIRRETEEACAQFQRTETLPVLFFKRAVN